MIKDRPSSRIHIFSSPASSLGRLTLEGSSTLAGIPCAMGRGGVSAAKREGDGRTPLGRLALRQVFYRADREARPRTALPTRAIRPCDIWCDDPLSPFYNLFLPLRRFSSVRGEALYRADPLYDVFVALGFNDAPPRRGEGSAIFLHIAAKNLNPTKGCLALPRGALLRLLAECKGAAALYIHGRPFEGRWVSRMSSPKRARPTLT